MNDLIFLNHAMLFNFNAKQPSFTTPCPNYFSIYQFFPFPPGIEYFLSRNKVIDLNGPWRLEPTQYPMPVAKNISFAEAADTFGQSIIDELDQGKQAYMMWSGGIDSTSILVSVLKHIQPHHRDQFCIVLSESTRRENPVFYHKFLQPYAQIELEDFNVKDLDLATTIILDGEGGDQVFGSSAANKLFSLHPEKIMLPWRNQIDFLKTQWHKESVPGFWDFFINIMTETINVGSADVDTLYDFYWWLNFNFKFDSVMFRHTLHRGENLTDDKFEYFAKNVFRRMFASEKIQQWSMTAGAPDKIKHARKTVKWAGRKYIYDFDHNEYYFREKRKEFSTSTIANIASRYFAIDRNYQRYSVLDRSVRQGLSRTFYKG